jgi:cytoskeleton protein RodZ
MLVRKDSSPQTVAARSAFSAESGQSISTGVEEAQVQAGDLITPGIMLQKARIAKNLTEQEVADDMHLSLQWIQDIEEDKFSKAPALIYIRGYLRSYARLVDLPANSILEAFAAMGWEEVATRDEQDWLLSISKGSSRRRLVDFYKQIRYGFAIVSIIILLLLVSLWWYVGRKHGQVATSEVSSTAALQPVLVGQKPVASTLQRQHGVNKTKNTNVLRQDINNQQNVIHNKSQKTKTLQSNANQQQQGK